jgi:type I restriction enzyme M protein
MVDRLSNLVAIFNRPELDFRRNRAEGDDILGDAYEYLEAEIRKRIVQKGYIKGIIGLPANLFYGTGIPACIVVLEALDRNAAFRQ